MPLPVSAIYSGMQADGHWAGTPSLVVQLMEHPDAELPSPETRDGSWPFPDWDYDMANEISLRRLVERRYAVSHHFASVGVATLMALICSYRERHILVVARDPGLHDIVPLLKNLTAMAGRTVQIEAAVLRPSLMLPKVWLSLVSLPARVGSAAAAISVRPSEVIACVRWRSDIERAEMAFADRRLPVLLRPSPFADGGIYRQCVSVATRHPGWRVMAAPKVSAAAV